MCGDFDHHDGLDDELFERFLALAAERGVTPQADGRNCPAGLGDVSARRSYMDGLFKAGLTRAASDAAMLPAGERADAMAGQAIVFARLAGFLAGQFPPQADLFRTITAAMLEGCDEVATR
jgi:hypothetical protein